MGVNCINKRTIIKKSSFPAAEEVDTSWTLNKNPILKGFVEIYYL